jgi:hypothetical protein
MFSYIALKKLNRKTFSVFHKDGLLDIFLGITFFSFGFWLLMDNVLFTFISWMSFGVYRYLKKTVTIPRVGYARFREDKKQQITLIVIWIIVLALLLVFRYLLFGVNRPDLFISTFLRKNHVYLMGSIGGLIIMSLGLWRGLYRFAAYGFLFCSILAIFFFNEIHGMVAFFIMGGLVSIIGLILLAMFIRKTPNHSGGVEDGS